MSREEGRTSNLIDLRLGGGGGGGGAQSHPASVEKMAAQRPTGLSSNTLNFLQSLRQSSASLRAAGRSPATSNSTPTQPSVAPSPSPIRSRPSTAKRSAAPTVARKISPSITPLSSILATRHGRARPERKLFTAHTKDLSSSSSSSLSSIVHVIRSLDELGISSEEDNGTHDAITDNAPESDSIPTVQEKQLDTDERNAGALPPKLPISTTLKKETEHGNERIEDVFKASEHKNNAFYVRPASRTYSPDFDDNGSSIATEVFDSERDEDVESSIPEEPGSSSSVSKQTGSSATENDSSSSTSPTDNNSTSSSSTATTTQHHSIRRDKRNVNNRTSRTTQTTIFELQGTRRFVLAPSVLRQMALRYADDARNLNGPVNTALFSILDAQIDFIRTHAEYQWEALNRWNALMEQQIGDFTSSSVLQAKLGSLHANSASNV